MNDDELIELTEQTPPEEPVRAIRWHEMAASTLTDRADEHRWEAARLIAAELDSGTTQRELAGAIGKSVAHVNYMNRAWRKSAHLGEQDRPSFNEAYHDRGQRAGAEHVLNDSDRRAELEAEIAKDPASVARINEKARQLRPEPRPRPVQRAHPLVAVSDFGAAEAIYRKALAGIEEVVRDGRLHPSELEESINEVDRWKTRLTMLRGWTGDMDEQLENLINGELP